MVAPTAATPVPAPVPAINSRLIAAVNSRPCAAPRRQAPRLLPALPAAPATPAAPAAAPSLDRFSPLQHPWEEQFSTTHQRMLYINHETKSTQWSDPRLETAGSGAGGEGPLSASKAATPAYSRNFKNKQALFRRKLSSPSGQVEFEVDRNWVYVSSFRALEKFDGTSSPFSTLFLGPFWGSFRTHFSFLSYLCATRTVQYALLGDHALVGADWCLNSDVVPNLTN